MSEQEQNRSANVDNTYNAVIGQVETYARQTIIGVAEKRLWAERCAALLHERGVTRACSDLGLEVRLQPWWPEHARVEMRRGSLQDFAAAVRALSNALGDPESVSVDKTSYDNRGVPALRAEWCLADIGDGQLCAGLPAVSGRALILTNYSPTGCKVDPRSEFRAGSYSPTQVPDLHPECMAVMEELRGGV